MSETPNSAPSGKEGEQRRRRVLAIVGLVVLVLIAGGVIWLLVSGNPLRSSVTRTVYFNGTTEVSDDAKVLYRKDLVGEVAAITPGLFRLQLRLARKGLVEQQDIVTLASGEEVLIGSDSAGSGAGFRIRFDSTTAEIYQPGRWGVSLYYRYGHWYIRSDSANGAITLNDLTFGGPSGIAGDIEIHPGEVLSAAGVQVIWSEPGDYTKVELELYDEAIADLSHITEGIRAGYILALSSSFGLAPPASDCRPRHRRRPSP